MSYMISNDLSMCVTLRIASPPPPPPPPPHTKNTSDIYNGIGLMN